MMEHTNPIVMGFAVAALMIAMSEIFVVLHVKARMERLEGAPPEPEKKPRKNARIKVWTKTGSRIIYATNVSYPPDGKLVFTSNENKACAIVAAGHWYFVESIADEPEPESKGENEDGPALPSAPPEPGGPAEGRETRE